MAFALVLPFLATVLKFKLKPVVFTALRSPLSAPGLLCFGVGSRRRRRAHTHTHKHRRANARAGAQEHTSREEGKLKKKKVLFEDQIYNSLWKCLNFVLD